MSRATIFRRLADENVPSYTAPDGDRMIWVGPEPAPAWLAELAGVVEQLVLEIAELRRAVARGSEGVAGRAGSRSSSTRAPTKPVSDAASLSPDFQRDPLRPAEAHDFGADELLVRLAAVQGDMADAAVERAAGLSQAFLSKARSGRQRGPRAARSWAMLAAWLDERGRRAA